MSSTLISKRFASLVKRVIEKHGQIIDLERNPELLREIFRDLGSTLADDPYPPDNPCGGTPPQPGPAGMRVAPTNDDIFRAVLTLSREVKELRKSMASAASVPSARKTRK